VSDRQVALTFDAEHPSRRRCPPGNDQAMLDVLTGSGIRATFFVQGRWATAFPETAQRIVREGHLVGNHSDYHAPMHLLTDAGIECDVRKAEDRIRTVAGADPRPWFRCPFGEMGTDDRVAAILRSLGYRAVGWDVDGNDWDEERTASEVEESVVQGVLARADAPVVLLHTWPEPALRALPPIIGRLQREGYGFVTVDAALDGR